MRSVLEKVCTLWPEWETNAAIVRTWDKKLSGLDEQVLLESVDDLYADRSHFKTPSLSALLEIYRVKRASSTSTERCRFPDNYLQSVAKHLGLSDQVHPYEVILQWHRAQWKHYRKIHRRDDPDVPFGTRQIVRSCAEHLASLGMTTKDDAGRYDFSYAARVAEWITCDESSWMMHVQDVIDHAPRLSEAGSGARNGSESYWVELDDPKVVEPAPSP